MSARRDLTEYIEIWSRFRRSVNLEQDHAADAVNGDYVVTANTRQALDRVSEGLAHDSPSRAWTVTGPYGAGKTAFAVFLTRLLCGSEEQGCRARQQLSQADAQLTEQVCETGVWRAVRGGMLPVLLTARRAPASVCLLQALLAATGNLPCAKARRIRKELSALLEPAARGRTADSRKLLEAVKAVAVVAIEHGHWGVLLLVDELGKLLEFAARDPKQGDVFVLQELAEHASRSGDTPLLMVGFLHQSFGDYGQHLDVVTRREWEKIAGRFSDVPFLEPPDQVVRMIASAIKRAGRPLPKALLRRVRHVAKEAAGTLCPPAMKPKEFEDAAIRAYPLHPVTLMALPYLFKRFAQNERSLFAYLSAQEPFGFQDFLRRHNANSGAPPFVRLTDLFDYFTANFGIGLYRHPHARRWLEAVDILDRKSDLTEFHAGVVKATGILNALGEFSHLNAHEEVISLSLVDRREPTSTLREALAGLREQSVLTYRAFNNTFRVWEGSDVDIEERISQGDRRISGDLSLSESIQRYLPPRPLVARRHSFETGLPRFVEIAYVGDPEELTLEWRASPRGHAHVAVCLASSGAQLERFIEAAKGAVADRTDLLIAIPQEIGEVRAAVRELGALRWAWDNTPELRDDRVARREISLRISEAEHLLVRDLDGLLDPRPQPRGSVCLWFLGGRKQRAETPVAVSHLLSTVCDRLFSKAPRIRNELIARRSLSSAAAAARRSLIERMLTNAHQPLLGIEGYPPERSMYESVLNATGLHREDEAGEWGFHAPDPKGPHNLEPCWAFLCDRILTTHMEPVPVEEISAALARPPFGMPDGLHPVVLCAFLMVHRIETTLYREQTFIPEVAIADFEVLMRRPELYAVAGGRVSGVRAAVVERLAKGLEVEPATVPVVRDLFRRVKALPEFAWQTRRLPEHTLALREAFSGARSPERFLFVDLPQALGMQPFSETDASSKAIGAFFEHLNENLQQWINAAPSTIRWARDELLDACGLAPSEKGWQQLRRDAARLAPAVTEPQLRTFLGRVTEASADGVGLESVLALVANRPPHSWRDQDREAFPEAAGVLGRSFRGSLSALQSAQRGTADDDGLTAAQRRKATALSGAIEQFLRADGRAPSARVMRAALLILAEKMGDKRDDG